jgi:hypothetical protein
MAYLHGLIFSYPKLIHIRRFHHMGFFSNLIPHSTKSSSTTQTTPPRRVSRGDNPTTSTALTTPPYDQAEFQKTQVHTPENEFVSGLEINSLEFDKNAEVHARRKTALKEKLNLNNASDDRLNRGANILFNIKGVDPSEATVTREQIENALGNKALRDLRGESVEEKLQKSRLEDSWSDGESTKSGKSSKRSSLDKSPRES